jgi:carbon monoxide dehydrogenase subunit G
MKIEKSFQIDAPQHQVWEFLSSPERVGECFPGCEHVTPLGDNKYKAAIRVEIGPIKTIFNIEFEEDEKRPPEFLAYSSHGEESHKASRLKAVSTLSLSPVDDSRTQILYTSELSIVGRLGKFGAGMMKKKADVLGDEFADELRRQILGPSGAPAEAAAQKPALSSRQTWLALAVVAAIIVLVAWFITR